MHHQLGPLSGSLSGVFPVVKLSADGYLSSMVFSPRQGEQKGHSEATVIEARTSDPASPVDGRMWLRTDL